MTPNVPLAADFGNCPPAAPTPLPVVRWVWLGALLAAELTALSLRFDSGTRVGLHAWWAELIGQAHVLPKVAIAVAAATFLFGGERLKADLSEASRHGRELPWWPFLLGHLTVLAAFTLLTGYLLEGEARASRWADAWAVVWAALAILVLALWAACAVPATRWLPFVRRGAGPLFAGVLIGLAAWRPGRWVSVRICFGRPSAARLFGW